MASFDLELFNFRLTKLLLLLIVEVVDLLCCVGVGCPSDLSADAFLDENEKVSQ